MSESALSRRNVRHCTERFAATNGLESLTHHMLTSDDPADEEATQRIFEALVGHEGDIASRQLARHLHARLLGLRKAMHRLRSFVRDDDDGGVAKHYRQLEERAAEAVVSAVCVLRKRYPVPQSPSSPRASTTVVPNSTVQGASPSPPASGRITFDRAPSAGEMVSPEHLAAGTFDLTPEEVQPQLFSTIDFARSLKSFCSVDMPSETAHASHGVAPPWAVGQPGETEAAMLAAPLEFVKDYVAHRRSVAHWMTNAATRELDLYCHERSLDLQWRSTLDTERGKLFSSLVSVDNFLTDHVAEKLERLAVDRFESDFRAADLSVAAEVLVHEKQAVKLLDDEQKQLKTRLQQVQLQLTAAQARVQSTAKRIAALKHDDAATVAKSKLVADKLSEIDVAIHDGEVRRWLARLTASFVSDLAAEAAKLNSEMLLNGEMRLREMHTRAALAVSEAITRSRDLVARLSKGRLQLVEALGMSPLSTDSTTTSHRTVAADVERVSPAFSARAGAITPDDLGGMQTAAQPAMGPSLDANVASCAKDILKVMSRVAAAAEDLLNKFQDLNERWQRDELPISDDSCAAIEAAYDELTATIDSTKGDALEQIFVSANATRMSVSRSLDDMEEALAAAGSTVGSSVTQRMRPRKGLPVRLCKTAAPKPATATITHDAGASTPRQAQGPSQSPALAGDRPGPIIADARGALPAIAFISQFKAAFANDLGGP